MKARPRSLLAVAALAVLLAPAAPALAQHPAHAAVEPAGGKAAATGAALRDLWVSHVFWARNVVTNSLAGNQAAAAAAEKEVVGNAKAIAGAIEPYYGKEASEKLFGLLAGHYGAIKELVQAGGNKDKEDAGSKKLTANAAEIGKLLRGANPNMPYDTLNGLLLAHGGPPPAGPSVEGKAVRGRGEDLGSDEEPHVRGRRRADRGDRQAVPGEVQLTARREQWRAS